MNSQELKEHFEAKLENYGLQRQKMKVFLSPAFLKLNAEPAKREFVKIIYGEVISELPRLTEDAIFTFKKDLNFKWNDKEKKQYLKKEFKDLERSYNASPFKHWFTINDFHNEVFEETIMKEILDTFLNELFKNDLLKEDETLDIDRMVIALKKVKHQLLYTFFIILKAKILKFEIANIRSKSIEINTGKEKSSEIANNNLIPSEAGIDPLSKNFTNNFDEVDVKTLTSYFKDKLVTPGYLNENELYQYLTLAFDKLEIPKHKFHFQKIKTKGKIHKIFYDYYKTIAQKPYGKKLSYIKLLGNYFEGYNNEKLENNFG